MLLFSGRGGLVRLRLWRKMRRSRGERRRSRVGGKGRGGIGVVVDDGGVGGIGRLVLGVGGRKGLKGRLWDWGEGDVGVDVDVEGGGRNWGCDFVVAAEGGKDVGLGKGCVVEGIWELGEVELKVGR